MKKILVFLWLLLLIVTIPLYGGKKKKDELYYYNMGTAMLQKKQPAKAITYLSKAAEMNPKNFQIFHALGIAYAMAGDLEKGEYYFRKTISLNPAYGPAHNLLGVILTEKGKYSEAEAEFKRALEDVAYPTKEVVYYNLAKLYLKMKDVDKALASLDLAIAANKDYANAYALKGSIYAQKGNLAIAEKLYKTAVDKDKDNPALLFALGEIYEKEGKIEEAKGAYSKVLVIPSDPQIKIKAEDKLKKLEKK